MIKPDSTFFWQFGNFVVMLFIFNLLLFKPIRGIIKKRTDVMAKQLSDIETFTSEAEAKMANYEESLNEARKKGQQIHADFKSEGHAEEQKLLDAAGSEAAAKLESARSEIASQRTAAEKDLENKVEEYAKLTTDKILGQV